MECEAVSGERWWYVVYESHYAGHTNDSRSTSAKILRTVHPLLWLASYTPSNERSSRRLLWWQELPNEIDPESLAEKIA